MRKDYTHIAVLLDSSGSMYHLQEETISNFNKFLKVQKEVKGKATLTVVLFNTTFKTLYDNIDIQLAKPLTKETYSPEGWTALLDVTATTVDSVGVFLAGLPESERPDKVIFCTITDGLENSSVKYSYADVKDRVERQTKVYKWEFVFLGANIDAYAVGASLGYQTSHTSTYQATTRGLGAMYSGAWCKMADYRSNVVNTMGFTEEEKTFMAQT